MSQPLSNIQSGEDSATSPAESRLRHPTRFHLHQRGTGTYQRRDLLAMVFFSMSLMYILKEVRRTARRNPALRGKDQAKT
eukprot:s776_g6.t1